LSGGAGDDQLYFSGPSNGWLMGDDGNDTLNVPWVNLEGKQALVEADGGAGKDVQIVNGPISVHSWVDYNDEMARSFEKAILRNGSGTFAGTDADEEFVVENGGSYHIIGFDGNDRLDARKAGASRLSAGGGNDVVFGSPGVDTIDGFEGDDALFGFGSDDSIIGGLGNDYLEGGDGNDKLFGDNDDGAGYPGSLHGNDTLHGGRGVDHFYGRDGNDLFYARDGEQDLLYGEGGTDRAQRDGTESVVDSVETTVA
jgi:Ca2+-binding RTX toxin-like protein